jgi:hypothetical protein
MKTAARFLNSGLLFVGLASAAVAVPAAVKYQIERAKVYYGNPDAYTVPCVVQASSIFKHIEAYKKIEEEGIKKDSARYFLLMQEATQTFRDVVKKVALAEKVDLVGEKGTVVVVGGEAEIRDLTKKVVQALTQG